MGKGVGVGRNVAVGSSVAVAGILVAVLVTCDVGVGVAGSVGWKAGACVGVVALFPGGGYPYDGSVGRSGDGIGAGGVAGRGGAG